MLLIIILSQKGNFILFIQPLSYLPYHPKLATKEFSFLPLSWLNEGLVTDMNAQEQ